MSKKSKNLRLLTNRIDQNSFEAFELAPNGVFLWIFETPSCVGSFVCSLALVEEGFAKAGRDFDPTKLPLHFTRCPYTEWK